MVSSHRRSDSGGQVEPRASFLRDGCTRRHSGGHVTGCVPCGHAENPATQVSVSHVLYPHTVLFFPQATAVGSHRHTSSFFCRLPCTSVCLCLCVVSKGCVAVSHFKVCQIQSLLFFVCVCVCLCANMDVLIAHYSSTTAHPVTPVF